VPEHVHHRLEILSRKKGRHQDGFVRIAEKPHPVGGMRLENGNHLRRQNALGTVAVPVHAHIQKIVMQGLVRRPVIHLAQFLHQHLHRLQTGTAQKLLNIGRQQFFGKSQLIDRVEQHARRNGRSLLLVDIHIAEGSESLHG